MLTFISVMPINEIRMKQEEPSQMTDQLQIVPNMTIPGFRGPIVKLPGVEAYMEFDQLPRSQQRALRSDLTPKQKAEALRIGRIEFKSAGATRKR
jgi:hypothetical protein